MRWLLAVTASLAVAVWLGSPRTVSAEAFVEEAVLGAADAPVTVIEYASMTCPHCAQFHAKAMPALKDEYIAKGKVRLVYRDFPLDAMALKAAMVARCGGEDRYFAFVDVIYGQQARWARSPDPVAALKQLVQIGGLRAGEVDACLADKALEDGHSAAAADRPERARGRNRRRPSSSTGTSMSASTIRRSGARSSTRWSRRRVVENPVRERRAESNRAFTEPYAVRISRRAARGARRCAPG